MKHKKRKKRIFKATDLRLDQKFLEKAYNRIKGGGYSKQKWVEFSELFLEKGFDVFLYEARQTCSKYITLRHPQLSGVSFKVRFSNHPPIKAREDRGDCDFFVGRANNSISTTADAVQAALRHFRVKWVETKVNSGQGSQQAQ